MTSEFAELLRRLRTERGLSLRELAALTHHGKSYLHDLETGRKPPTAEIARRLDGVLASGGHLVAVLQAPPDDRNAEIEGLELLRRVTASDVSHDTLDGLETVTDQMATAYATAVPGDLLPRVRRHLDYATSLLDARATLTQRRRLVVASGWLALLRATLHIDLRQAAAGDAYLAAAAQLAEQAGHREMSAWVVETRAWEALTIGDFRRALTLSQHAREVAPQGSSAYLQATAQQGRVWARLGDQAQTGKALAELERLADAHPAPDRPEHHYQYDPAKAHSYVATTLAWVGDPSAEKVAREVVAELAAEDARPRRIASAHLDLALALLGAGQPDEAAAAAQAAIGSGRVVPSNWWRAAEVVNGVQNAAIAEAAELHEAYRTFRPTQS